MKAKAIPYRPTKFFLLFMFAPLVLGLLITLKSNARADWESDTSDFLLTLKPVKQGWQEMR